jgi:type II secretory pathway pseudopilin PulG
MWNNEIKEKSEKKSVFVKGGFTLVEVLVAASIMIILCVGTLSVFSYVVKINRGENIRMQALSVLQQEVEHYRSLKFIPGNEVAADLALYRQPELRADINGGVHTRPNRTSADGKVFSIAVTVTNIASPSTEERLCRFKEITITATPTTAQSGWLSDLRTTVTIQRVRSN